LAVSLAHFSPETVEELRLLCTAGGTFPALAVLFARTMEAYETMDVKKNNFYALMFFIVAIGNFFAYFATGWAANITGQVSTRLYFMTATCGLTWDV
jgi:hypothetical protein